nr:hypothetical protein [[Clostridium] innocuum]
MFELANMMASDTLPRIACFQCILPAKLKLALRQNAEN